MQLAFEIPDDLASALRGTHGQNLGQAALERQGQRGVYMNYTMSDLEIARHNLDKIFPK